MAREPKDLENERLVREARSLRELLSSERATSKDKLKHLRDQIGELKDLLTQKDYKVRIGGKLIRMLVKGDMTVAQKKLWEIFNG
jgi:hypothetical protein